MKKLLLTALIGMILAPSAVFAISNPNNENQFGYLVRGKRNSEYTFAKNTKAKWARPHIGAFVWGKMQKKKNGKYNFTATDKIVKRAQKKDISLLVTLWPYASWDQLTKKSRRVKECKVTDQFYTGKKRQLPKYRCNPSDWDEYQKWVTAVVERYDGDGVDDMPKLKQRIRYWEVNNEPDLRPDSKSETNFFVGGPKKYRKLLTKTHNAIAAADSKAKVVVAAPSMLSTDSINYFKRVFSGKKIKTKFDIANVHCIGVCNYNTFDVEEYIAAFPKVSSQKSIWVTEAQAFITEDDAGLNATQFNIGVNGALKAGAARIFATHQTFERPENQTGAMDFVTYPTRNESIPENAEDAYKYIWSLY